MSVAGTREAAIEFVREGVREEVPVSLIAAPEDPPRATSSPGNTLWSSKTRVARINPAVIAEYGLALEATGVVITNPGRYAPRVGLRPRDVIEAVNGEEILTPRDVDRALKRSGRFQMTILRGDRRITLNFRT